MGKLSGKVALVTGGARGLGRAYALRLAQLGADVGIIDINLESYKDYEAEAAQMTAASVMDEVRALGVRSAGAVADISNKDQVFAAVQKIADELGDISIAVCNAGGGSGLNTENTPSEMDFAQFDMVMGRNLNGTAYTISAVAPMMKKNNWGRIITVASHVGIETPVSAGYTHYGTAKAGIMYYTRAASMELGPYNINVNCIAPGYITSGRMAQSFESRGLDYFINHTSLRRFGTPEECAGVVEFLVTDLSDFVTGTVIEITGGTTGRLGR